jgi:hypothetical protein
MAKTITTVIQNCWQCDFRGSTYDNNMMRCDKLNKTVKGFTIDPDCPLPDSPLTEEQIREVERLQGELFKVNVENDTLRMELEKFTLNESQAIELVRSALQIAIRQGKNTNWEGFEKQCRNRLSLTCGKTDRGKGQARTRKTL